MLSDNNNQALKQWKSANTQSIQQAKLDNSNSKQSLLDVIEHILQNSVEILRSDNNDTKYSAIVDLILMRIRANVNDKLQDNNNFTVNEIKNFITEQQQMFANIKIQDVANNILDIIDNYAKANESKNNANENNDEVELTSNSISSDNKTVDTNNNKDNIESNNAVHADNQLNTSVYKENDNKIQLKQKEKPDKKLNKFYQKQLRKLNSKLNKLDAIILKFTNVISIAADAKKKKPKKPKNSIVVGNVVVKLKKKFSKRKLMSIQHSLIILAKIQLEFDKMLKFYDMFIFSFYKVQFNYLIDISKNYILVCVEKRIKENIFQKIFSLLHSEIKDIVLDLLKDNKYLGKFFKFFNDAFQKVQKALNSMSKRLMRIIRVISKTLRKIFKIIKKVVFYPFRLAFRVFLATVRLSLQLIRFTLFGLWFLAGQVASGLWWAIRHGCQFIYNKVKDVIDFVRRKIPKKYRDKISSFFNKYKSKISSIYNKFKGRISRFIRKRLTGPIGNAIRGIRSFISKKLGFLTSRISSFISKLKGKISGLVRTVVTKIRTFARTLIRNIVRRLRSVAQSIVRNIARQLGKMFAKKARKKAMNKIGSKILGKLLKYILKPVLKWIAKKIAMVLALAVIPGPGTLLAIATFLYNLYDAITMFLEIYKMFKENPGMWDMAKTVVVDFFKNECSKLLGKLLEWGKKAFRFLFIDGPKKLLAAAGKAFKAMAAVALHPIDTAKIAQSMIKHSFAMQKLRDKNLDEFYNRTKDEKFAFWELNFENYKKSIFEQIKKVEQLNKQILDELNKPYKLFGDGYSSDRVFKIVDEKQLAIQQYINFGSLLGLYAITPENIAKIEALVEKRKHAAEKIREEYEHYLDISNKEINLIELNNIINENRKENNDFFKKVSEFADYMKNEYNKYYGKLKPYINEETIMDYADDGVAMNINSQSIDDYDVDDVAEDNSDIETDE